VEPLLANGGRWSGLPPFLKSEGGRLALAVAGVCTALFAVTKCGGSETTAVELGNVTISVQVTPGLPLERVGYQLENARARLALEGSLALDEAARATAAVRSIPAGRPWTVALTATSADGDVTCLGSASFEVLARQTTSVMATLTCQSRSGAVLTTAPSKRCSIIQSLAVAPTQTALGGALELGVQTLAAERLGLRYAWTGAGGSFADAAAASTRYTCQEPGAHTLALRVWDETCTDRTTVTVRCTSLDCGNGRLDPEESCEPPGTSSCDLGCRKIEGCGNARIDPGEQCDDGNTAGGDGCSATCTSEAICGNGVVEAGEDCEPPGAGTCSSVCRTLPGR
jgi:cysteine-rich repeat protein